MENLPLVNGTRLLTRSRTRGSLVAHAQAVFVVAGVRAEDILLAPLKLDGSGSSSLNVDGSVTAQRFWYTAPADKWTTIRALTMAISDDAAVIAGGFGGLAALATGLALEIVRAPIGEEVPDASGMTVLADLTGSLGIKSHADLTAIGADVRFADTASGVDVVSARLEFATPIELGAGHRFRITVRDDLTGLTALRAFVAGDFAS